MKPSPFAMCGELSGCSGGPMSVHVLSHSKNGNEPKTRDGTRMTTDWQPDGWWRVIAPDGSLWCESSDEEENRHAMRPGDKLQRHMKRVEQKWEDANPAEDQRVGPKDRRARTDEGRLEDAPERTRRIT